MQAAKTCRKLCIPSAEDPPLPTLLQYKARGDLLEGKGWRGARLPRNVGGAQASEPPA